MLAEKIKEIDEIGKQNDELFVGGARPGNAAEMHHLQQEIRQCEKELLDLMLYSNEWRKAILDEEG